VNIHIELGRKAWSAKTGSGAIIQAGLGEQLDGMAHQLKAEGYAVLRSAPLRSRLDDGFSLVLSRLGKVNECRFDALIARISPLATDQLEQSLLPILVGAKGKTQLRLAKVLPMPEGGAAADHGGELPACIVLPVKLGALGNGCVVFFGLDGPAADDLLLEVHRKCYKVLKTLLTLDLRKSAPRQHLNDRELACLQLAGEGLKSELIAEQLSLSVHTVNAYLSSATAKLDSVNRIQAIAKAIRLGYLS
jgi:DNA-binding CsgD family transcriptional regulator